MRSYSTFFHESLPAGRVGHATSWRMAPHLPGLDLVEIDPEAAEETDPAPLRALLRR